MFCTLTLIDLTFSNQCSWLSCAEWCINFLLQPLLRSILLLTNMLISGIQNLLLEICILISCKLCRIIVEILENVF